jgi:superfamily II DNA or RNA helicase
VLDEGVDLPISDAAIMCRSNASYRQWIQRRGRVLRKKDPKDASKALIIDFILDLTPFNIEVRKKLRKNYASEVKRMEEFGSSSESTYDTILQSLEESGWEL